MTDDVAAKNSVSLLRFCGVGSLRPFLAKGGEEVDHRQLLESVLCHLEEEREKQLQELLQILDEVVVFQGWCRTFLDEYLAHLLARTTSQVTVH